MPVTEQRRPTPTAASDSASVSHGTAQRQPTRPDLVEVGEEAVDRPRLRHRPAGQELGREHRHQRQADDHRHQHGDRQRPAQRGEELAVDAGDERQRHEHQHGRQRRADDGPGDLAGGGVDRIGAGRHRRGGWPPLRRSPTVLAGDRGPSGARWRAMFSMTTTVSSMMRPMATARPPSDIRLSVSPVQCRNRNVIASVVGMARAEISVARQLRRNASRIRMLNRPPIRMASRTLSTAVSTNVGLVVDHGRLDVARRLLVGVAGRQRQPFLSSSVGEVLRDVDRVAAQPAEDGDDHGVALVEADRQRAVLVQHLDVGHVADAQRLVLAGRDDQVLDLAGRLGLGVDEDLEGERLALDAADRLQRRQLADLVGEVGGGQAGGQQVVGPGR